MLRRLKLSPWWLVAAIVAAATSYHYLQARQRVTPWIFPDENRYAAFARAVAETGKATVRGEHIWQESLQSYLLAPAWSVHDVGVAFELSKATSCLFFALTAVPTYLLARNFSPTWAALLASAGAVLIPAAIYGSTLMQEPFALPAAMAAAYLSVRFIERPNLRMGLGLAAACIAGIGMRGELVVIPAAVVVALGTDWVARHVRSHPRQGATWIASATALAALVAAGTVAQRTSYLDLGAGVRSLAAASLAVAVVPMVALVGSLQDLGNSDRARSAFSAVALVFGLAFVAYTARKASTIPISLTAVEERNLIYLEPLAMVALAGWCGRLRIRAALAGGIALCPVIWSLSLPKVAAGPILTENPGLSWFWHIGRSTSGTSTLLMVIAVLAVPLLMLAQARAVLLLAAGAITAVAGSYAYRGDHAVAQSVATVWFQPERGWVDRAADGRRVTILTSPDITDLNGLELLYFWNRSIHDYVGALGGASLGIAGRQLAADATQTFPVARGGLVLHTELLTMRGKQIVAPLGAYYVLSGTDDRLVGLSGQRAVIAGSVTGRFRDGWIGENLTIRRFDGAIQSRGPMRLVVDTRNPAINAPHRITVRLGSFKRAWIIPPNVSRELVVPLPPRPFELTVRATPTVTAGPTDPRQISVQLPPVIFPDVI